MARHYILGFLILFSCYLIEALPLNNEETTPMPLDLTTLSNESNIENKEERSLMYEEGPNPHGNTREIVDKIKAINDAIGKPHKRPQINWNTQPQTGGSYVMDKDVLEKLQQIIASGKPYKNNLNLQDDNTVSDIEELRVSRQMASQVQKQQVLSMLSSMPYITSIPVLVMPSPTPARIGNNYLNSMLPIQSSYQTRQGFGGISWPNFNFDQIEWPASIPSLFPILIKNPFTYGWNDFIENGQTADICRKQKSSDNDDLNDLIEETSNTNSPAKTRQGRDIKKRTVLQQTRLQEVDNVKKSNNKFFSSKKPTTTTRKPVKQAPVEQNSKKEEEGDLRFGSEFTLFGNKKPVVPSPGFFINRLKVRRGGVAIAGPGGIATAGRGGTAIVGPGGLAYTKPGSLAVAGPAARVVALAPDADLNSLISKLYEQDSSVPRSLQPILEGKVVAIGPVIYFNPNKPSDLDRPTEDGGGGNGRGQDVYRYDGMRFGKDLPLLDPSFLLFLKPVAHALSPNGLAIANPVSNVVIAFNRTGSVVHMPIATAIAGPGGIAHAQADLNLYQFDDTGLVSNEVQK